MKHIAIIVSALALATQVASASKINCSLNPFARICINLSSADQIVATLQKEYIKSLIATTIDGEYFGNLAALEAIYEEQLAEQIKQNKLLEKYLALLQQSALQEKKIAFLTSKFNQIQSIKNEIEGGK